MTKLTAAASTLAALNESTGTGDVVLAWENMDGVTILSCIPRQQLVQILVAHKPNYIEPCGGCGETDPKKRCINCWHPFNQTAQPN